jgi:hypothetical protein
MRVFILSFIVLVFANCTETSEGKSEQKEETEWATQQPKTPSTVDISDYKTRSGKKFTVIEKKLSASLSRITVQGTGFPNSQEVFTLKDADPIQEGLQGDLDGDGYEELYLITRSAGSGSQATIYGFASYNDLSYGPIYLPEPEENDVNFRGYMGHDKISILGNRLLREFPVYNSGDPNSRPSGGSRVLKYALERGEASFALVVKEITTHH